MRPRDGLNIGSKRSIVAQVMGGMLPNHINHRYMGPARIVEICQAVAKAGTEVQQSARRFPGHARVAVCRASYYTLKEAQHAAYFRDAVEACDQMNFRCAGIGEAGVNAVADQRANQIFGPVHRATARSLAFLSRS